MSTELKKVMKKSRICELEFVRSKDYGYDPTGIEV